MKDLKTDTSGQWLLLGSMLVAVGLAVLIVFVNQSMLAGHSSSESIMDFPKNDIRELHSETVGEAYLLGTEANAQGTSLADRQARFQTSFARYVSDLRHIYSINGAIANVIYDEGLNYSSLPGGQSLDNVTLFIYYSDGETTYNETNTIYMV